MERSSRSCHHLGRNAKNTGKLKRVQNGFGAVAPLLEGKKFVLGDTISFADVTIVSRVLLIKRLLGAQSPEWKAIEGWNGGMWAAHVAKFAEYEKVVV